METSESFEQGAGDSTSAQQAIHIDADRLEQSEKSAIKTDSVSKQNKDATPACDNVEQKNECDGDNTSNTIEEKGSEGPVGDQSASEAFEHTDNTSNTKEEKHHNVEGEFVENVDVENISAHNVDSERNDIEVTVQDTKEAGAAEPDIAANDKEIMDDHKVDNVADAAELEGFEDVSGSEESGSDGEYESAEEGEELSVDAQHLKDIEESLSEEEKEEKKQAAQALKTEGNELFKSGSYKSAIRTYSRALRTCPLKFKKERSIMYSNRSACKMRLEDKEEAIRDCSKALELHPHYTKALLRRAELYEATDKLEEALKDFQNVLELDPSTYSARAACLRLPDQITERNEKLKEEMMGKLKDLGNMVLRPFGLSTNNFQMNQDPNTGGYSVNFVQSPNN